MLVRNLAVLLFSGVLATSALKLSAFEDIYQSLTSNAQQIPFGASRVLNYDGVQEGLEDGIEADMVQYPQKSEDETIYQVLSNNPKFSRLIKIINISDDIVSLLNDTSAHITFFAAPNRALRPPMRSKRHPMDFTAFSGAYASYDLPEIVAEIEELENCPDDDPDKERRKKFIKILVKAILSYHVIPKGIDIETLTYNTTYATNLVIPDDALDKEALRVRVSTRLLPPSVRINFFSTVVKPNIGTKNGIIHVVNHPLLPPPSIFQEIFLAPRIFGAVTSGLQRIGLTNAVEWRYVPNNDGDKKWSVEGTGSTTFFVPSNLAFKRLPWKLELFLFTPFGEKVLKKLLQFHIVPDVVLHSDYLYNATSDENVSASAWPEVFGDLDAERPFELESNKAVGHHHPPPGSMSPPPRPSGDFPYHPHGPLLRYPPRSSQDLYGDDRHSSPAEDRLSKDLPYMLNKPVFSAKLTVPTLLTNHSLHVHVTKDRHRIPIPGHKKDIYITKLFVNHQIVVVADVVSRNGAVHVINKVLNPRPPHHRPHKPESGFDFAPREDDDGWEDWEDWLPQWAAEN